MIRRIINYSLCIMFLLFAAVQYNDPDPILWILIYTYAALMCLLAGMGKYYKYPLLSGSIVSLLWALSLATAISIALTNYGPNSIFSFSMIKDKEVEEARESLGLLIVFAVFIWKYFEGKKILQNM